MRETCRKDKKIKKNFADLTANWLQKEEKVVKSDTNIQSEYRNMQCKQCLCMQKVGRCFWQRPRTTGWNAESYKMRNLRLDDTQRDHNECVCGGGNHDPNANGHSVRCERRKCVCTLIKCQLKQGRKRGRGGEVSKDNGAEWKINLALYILKESTLWTDSLFLKGWQKPSQWTPS